jgi:hypothetical protein
MHSHSQTINKYHRDYQGQTTELRRPYTWFSQRTYGRHTAPGPWQIFRSI